MHRSWRVALQYVIVAACLTPAAGAGRAITVVDREAADLFEILDNASEWWPGYTETACQKYWIDSIAFRPGDSAVFAR